MLKSGSTLINDIIREMTKEVAIPVVDLPTYCFSNGISLDSIACHYASFFSPTGYCYAGFRAIPAGLRGIIHELPGRKMLLVRDPRDMLVSMYYSVKFSHQFPRHYTKQLFSEYSPIRASAKFSLDEFCILNAYIFLIAYRDYSNLIGDERTKIFRYEDVIFNKLELVRDLNQWFSLGLCSKKLGDIARMFDILPREDQPNGHIRQVTPGDHLRKLQKETIQMLDQVFAEFLATFGYNSPLRSASRQAEATNLEISRSS
jgi:hypothetical protein